MNRFTKLLSTVALVTFVVALCATSMLAATPKYVITNDDNFNAAANTASIYSIGTGGTLTLVKTISTGGTGAGGGYFATPRVNVLRSTRQNCAYVGDAYAAGGFGVGPGDVAAIDMSSLSLAGTFPGFPLDVGGGFGISLAETPTGTFLFAAYAGSGTIVSYKQEAGCKLKLLSELITVGARDGAVDGMKVTPNGKTLIVGYSDGSIGSYKINSTTGAVTLIARYLVTDGGFAGGVDITKNGKWALFGDAASSPTVEVAPIHANGSLGPTVGYSGIGAGSNSNSVWLSPDETLVYVSNNSSGTIAAAPFNAATGVINTASACTSAVLKNFGNPWFFLGGIATGSTATTGSPLYAAEFGNPSSIGIVRVKKGPPCVLTETSTSPASDSSSPALLTIGVDPPRPF
jgi:hypothetical protein